VYAKFVRLKIVDRVDETVADDLRINRLSICFHSRIIIRRKRWNRRSSDDVEVVDPLFLLNDRQRLFHFFTWFLYAREWFICVRESANVEEMLEEYLVRNEWLFFFVKLEFPSVVDSKQVNSVLRLFNVGLRSLVCELGVWAIEWARW